MSDDNPKQFWMVFNSRGRGPARRHRSLAAAVGEAKRLANKHPSAKIFGAKRASQVVEIAKRLLTELGEKPANKLRRMNSPDAYGYLTRLPGVGPKSALCVMMCSLDRDVFPVDVNVQRVFERLGLLRKGLKHYQAQQIAPRFVPPGRSKELHVGLVEHGRKICVPNRPKCECCVLSDMCAHGAKVLKKRRKGVAI